MTTPANTGTAALIITNLLLDTIEKIVHNAPAEAAIVVVRMLISTYRDMEAGKVLPSDVRKEAEKLLSALHADDALADDAVKAKFSETAKI